MEDVKFNVQKAHENLMKKPKIGLHRPLIKRLVMIMSYGEMGRLNRKYQLDSYMIDVSMKIS